MNIANLELRTVKANNTKKFILSFIANDEDEFSFNEITKVAEAAKLPEEEGEDFFFALLMLVNAFDAALNA